LTLCTICGGSMHLKVVLLEDCFLMAAIRPRKIAADWVYPLLARTAHQNVQKWQEHRSKTVAADLPQAKNVWHEVGWSRVGCGRHLERLGATQWRTQRINLPPASVLPRC
jgi:hypothetical protein